MFLAKTTRRSGDGSLRTYYVLRDSYWDKKLKRQRHRYIAYLGPKPVLTLAKARALARKLDCSLEDLKRVKRLKIVESGEQDT